MSAATRGPKPTLAITGSRPATASTVARATSQHSSGDRPNSSPVPLGATIAASPVPGSQAALRRTPSRSTFPSARYGVIGNASAPRSRALSCSGVVFAICPSS
jgi:hypothetical protein